jgi:hypothetical protein
MSITGRYITMRGGNIIGAPPMIIPPSLLLDLYPATAAFSVRKLRTAYTGACMRVRRSSDNTEQDIGFSGGELDTASLLSFVGANNGFVVTWYDQSGSNNITRPVLSQQPKIVSSGVVDSKGLKPSISFDGSDDVLVYSSPIVALNSGSQFSIFNVHHSNLLNTIRTFWTTSTGGSANQMRGFGDTRNIASPINFFVNNSGGTGFSATLSTTRNNTDQRLQVSVMDSGNVMRGFDNGATGGTATYTGTYANNILQLGNGANGALNGGVQEFIIFDTNQLANRTAIETNINTYYGIY